MDFTPEQTNNIEEIEKQINQDDPAEPKIISQSEVKDKSRLVNLLAGLGIIITGITAVVLIMIIPSNKKRIVYPTFTTENIQLLPNITVTTQYVNPFSNNSQYQNPFIASENPFNNLTQ